MSRNVTHDYTPVTPQDIKAALRNAMKLEMESSENVAAGESFERMLSFWFDPLLFETHAPHFCEEDDVAKLRVVFPHAYFDTWFGSKGRDMLQSAAKRHFGGSVTLEYSCVTGNISVASGMKFRTAHSRTSPISQLPPAAPGDGFELMSAPHNSRLFGSDPGLLGTDGANFDMFLVNAANKFTLDVLQKSASGDTSHNPLLLRGVSGTGKTLLLKIMAESYCRLPSTGSIYALSARDFAALLFNDTSGKEQFRRDLRHCAAFCLDDVQQLENSPVAQLELASLLEYLCALNIPVLVSSALPADSKSGDQLTLLQPALFSRLCMGLVLELSEPDMDVKMRYAQTLLSDRSLPAHRDLALSLARRCSGFRQLQGVVGRISAFYAYSGQLPDERDLDTIFRSSGSPGQMTPEAVLAMVASRCGFTPKDLRGKKRHPELVEARQLAMFLCRELLGESYPALGRIFGNKDHSTVIHAVKKIKKKQAENKDMHNLVTELTQSCRKHGA